MTDTEGPCVYCEATVPDRPPPAVHDETAWAQLAGQHSPGCAWVETRAHRVPGAVVTCSGCGAEGHVFGPGELCVWCLRPRAGQTPTTHVISGFAASRGEPE